jgi:hypothetical protein
MAASFARALIRCLPQSWAGFAHLHIKPTVLDGFGVFNGQCFRQLIFIDLFRTCCFHAIIETGTYVGCTTRFMAKNSNVPVYTVESDRKTFYIAKQHLKNYPGVHLTLGDSVEFLKSLPLAPEDRIFFYLDAHWGQHLPLREETDFIFSSYKNFVIMIDDFAVPNDEGYRYDDYGQGAQIGLRDFPYHTDPRVSAYFPSRRASEESGERRGSIILASVSMTPLVDSLDCLRRVTGQASKQG